ncbi:hypothetical protein D9M70_543420 [compost metagenome]
MLDAERVRVAGVEEDARQATAQARQQVAAAQAAQRAAETRLTDLELMLAQCQAQLDDRQNRCTALTEERKEALHAVNTLRQELQAVQQQLTQERESSAVYVRGVEDRAHREVDRAREESRAAAALLKIAGKQQEQLRQRLDTALAQLSEAQQVAAAESARAMTLTQQLSLPARTRRGSAKPAKSTKPAKRPRKSADTE